MNETRDMVSELALFFLQLQLAFLLGAQGRWNLALDYAAAA